MKKIILPLFFIVLLAFAGAVAYEIQAPKIVHPVLKKYGPVYDVPFAVEGPDTNMEYKIVADVGAKNERPGEIYEPLTNLARMYNLHIYGGVKQSNLKVAIVIWGDAIGIIENNEAYRKKYAVDNPNLKIIDEMSQAGVRFYGCSQSMMKFGVDPATVNPEVTIALSRFTAVSTFELKGYAYFKY